MCRFVAYLGEPVSLDLLFFKPKNSLVHQSLDSQEFSLRVNGDGFGVAWYPDGREVPVRLRTITPAWNNANLRSLAPATSSRCVLAHVRSASPGLPVVETNCHPFVHGTLAFCHNGAVGTFPEKRRALLAPLSDHAFADIEGTTDSEVVFAHVMDAYRKNADLAGALEHAIRKVVEIVDAPSYLNLCVTDGRRFAATRFSTAADGATSSLYVHQGRRYACIEGTCRMVDADQADTAVIIASERMSDDEGWDAFPAGQVCSVETGGPATFRKLVV